MVEELKIAALHIVIPSEQHYNRFKSNSLYSYVPPSLYERSVFTILFTFALLASGTFVNKLLLVTLSPTLLVALRMLMAGLILSLYTWRSHKEKFLLIKQDWLTLTGVAFFTTFMPSLLKAYALKNLHISQATLLGSVDPFITAFYTYLLWHEKLTLNKVGGISLGALGVILSTTLPTTPEVKCVSPLLAQVAALAAVALSRFGWILVQVLLKKNRYSPPQLNSLIMITSGVFALTAVPFLDPLKAVTILSPLKFTLLLIYTVIVGNVFGYTLYSHVLKHNNATLVSLAGFSVPLFATLYGWFFLYEPITLRFVLSAAVIFTGLLVFYYDDIKKRRLS